MTKRNGSKYKKRFDLIKTYNKGKEIDNSKMPKVNIDTLMPLTLQQKNPLQTIGGSRKLINNTTLISPTKPVLKNLHIMQKQELKKSTTN